MLAIVQTKANDLVGVRHRWPKLNRFERDNVAACIQLLVRPGQNIRKFLRAFLQQCAYRNRISSRRSIGSGINYSLIALNTSSPGVTCTTKTITHEIHENLPYRLTGDDNK